MDINKALIAFYALSQETRLRVFKILIEYGKTGAAAGVVSDRMKIPHNTLSFHFKNLSHAGLVSSRKEGRSVIYMANTDAIEGLIGYLSENCCILEESSGSCCPPKPIKKSKR